MERPSRRPEEIARQIDADLAAREQKELQKLRTSLALGYMEMLLLAAIFAFGIGLVVTVIYGLPQDNEALYNFMVLWIVGFIGALIVAIEFLIRKFRLIRRYLELLERRISRLEPAPPEPEQP